MSQRMLMAEIRRRNRLAKSQLKTFCKGHKGKANTLKSNSRQAYRCAYHQAIYDITEDLQTYWDGE